MAQRKAKPEAKVITKDDCPYCTKLKNQLKVDGVSYVEVDRASVKDFPYKTVPQLWLSGEHIGGYTEYMSLKHQNLNDDKYEECEACSG